MSDIHASRLSVGMRATIRLNDSTIPGSVETVYPSVENGTARVAIALDDASNKFLRPNLRVDVESANQKFAEELRIKAEKDSKKKLKRDEETVAERTAIHEALQSLDFS